jgi:predicted ribosomally synthesized peptide with SipW-like signal peptide
MLNIKSMKKIIISLAVIGIVAGITLGITGAWFTDEEPIENNVFQAGTLDIQQGPNDLGNMTLSDLMPGVVTDPQKLQMGNNGTLHAIIDKIEVTSLTNDDTDGDTTNNVSAADYAAMVNTTISDEVGRPLWKGTLGDLYGADKENAIDGTDRVFLAKKNSGGNYTTRDYWFTFQLDPNVSNAYQGEGVNATLSVNATQIKDNKFDAAERLVMNQNNDDGWDRIENNEKTTASSKNLFGVTGMGLLRAYEFSGDSDYFASAEKAAYKIANSWCDNYNGVKASCTTAGTSWLGGGGYTNEDILFLQRMGKYWNDGNLFTTKAEEAIIERWNVYDNDAQKVYDFIENLRSGSPDLFYWDLAPIVENTIDAANTVSNSNQAMILKNNALDLVALVAADQKPAGHFITAWANGDARLGQASAIRILQLADDMSLDVDYSTEIANGVTALLTQQETDGSFKWTDKKSIQTSAYAALALETAGDHANAQKAVDYIESQQLSNGGWYEKEGTDEYPEINSEALRAMIVVSE